MSITFEEYDEISEQLSDFKKELGTKFLHEDVVKTIFSVNPDYYLGFIIWILENAERNKIYDYLNKLSRKNIDICEDKISSSFKIDIKDKKKMLSAITILKKYAEPEEFLNETFLSIALKYPYYFAGILYWILTCAKKDDKVLKKIKAALNENKNNLIRVSIRDYEKIVESVNTVEFSDDWFPSVQDIKTYIVPNVALCLDFMIYYLRKPEEPGQKEARDLMVSIIYENFEFEGGCDF